MKRIAIFYMIKGANSVENGGGSYTAHLCRSFAQMGYEVDLLRITGRTGDREPFTQGVMSSNISMADASKLTESMPCFIAYSQFKWFTKETTDLLRRGVGIVFHATAELYPELLYLLRLYHSPVVVIRPAVCQILKEEDIKSTFIHHPYICSRDGGKRPEKSKYRAVSVNRIDYAKHTQVAIEANRMVEAHQRVKIFSHIERMYAYHILDREYPGWKEDYCGVFAEVMPILRDADICVDLTYWKGYGGGSQYTFLEAWDAGTALVVHTRWTGDNSGEVAHGKTALEITTADDLSRLLIADDPLTERVISGGKEALKLHTPEVVIPLYEEVFKMKG